jgi:hypothetical protein
MCRSTGWRCGVGTADADGADARWGRAGGALGARIRRRTQILQPHRGPLIRVRPASHEGDGLGRASASRGRFHFTGLVARACVPTAEAIRPIRRIRSPVRLRCVPKQVSAFICVRARQRPRLRRLRLPFRRHMRLQSRGRNRTMKIESDPNPRNRMIRPESDPYHDHLTPGPSSRLFRPQRHRRIHPRRTARWDA